MKIRAKIIAFIATIGILLTIVAILLLSLSQTPQETAKKAFDNKQYSETRKILEHFQTDDPENPTTSFNLGVTNYRDGRYSEAEKHFVRSANLAQKKSGLSELQVKAHTNAGNSKFFDATKNLKENLQSKEAVAEAISNLERAADHCQNALDLEPKNQHARNNLETIEQLTNRLREYLEQLKNEPEKSEETRQKLENELDRQQKNQPQNQTPDSQQSQNSEEPQDRKDNSQKQPQQGQNQSTLEQQERNEQAQQKTSQDKNKTQNEGEEDQQKNNQNLSSKANNSPSNSEKSSLGGSGDNQKAEQNSQTQDFSMSSTGDRMTDSQEGQAKPSEKNGEQQKRGLEQTNNDTQNEGNEEKRPGEEQFSELMSQGVHGENETTNQEGTEKGKKQEGLTTASTENAVDENSEFEANNAINVQQLMEERGSRLLLDQLDNNEAQLQKRRILKLTKGTAPTGYGQKAW